MQSLSGINLLKQDSLDLIEILIEYNEKRIKETEHDERGKYTFQLITLNKIKEIEG